MLSGGEFYLDILNGVLLVAPAGHHSKVAEGLHGEQLPRQNLPEKIKHFS